MLPVQRLWPQSSIHPSFQLINFHAQGIYCVSQYRHLCFVFIVFNSISWKSQLISNDLFCRLHYYTYKWSHWIIHSSDLFKTLIHSWAKQVTIFIHPSHPFKDSDLFRNETPLLCVDRNTFFFLLVEKKNTLNNLSCFLKAISHSHWSCMWPLEKTIQHVTAENHYMCASEREFNVHLYHINIKFIHLIGPYSHAHTCAISPSTHVVRRMRAVKLHISVLF